MVQLITEKRARLFTFFKKDLSGRIVSVPAVTMLWLSLEKNMYFVTMFLVYVCYLVVKFVSR